MFRLLTPAILLFALKAFAADVELESRQACPGIHVFGARETTAPAGYGTAGVVVNLVLNAHAGSTSEAINYPACGGQSSCGGVSYGNSAVQGVAAVAAAVNSFNTRCPSTQLVLVGYSQVRTHRNIHTDHKLRYMCWTRKIGWSNYGRRVLRWGGCQRRSFINCHPHSSVRHQHDQGCNFHGWPPLRLWPCSIPGRHMPCLWCMSLYLNYRWMTLTVLHSLRPGLPASRARMQPRSSLTATPPTRTAATAAMRTPTKVTARNTARLRLLSSTPNLPRPPPVVLHQPRAPPRPQPRPLLPQVEEDPVPLLIMDSVVELAGQALPPALRRTPARPPTRTTASAFDGS